MCKDVCVSKIQTHRSRLEEPTHKMYFISLQKKDTPRKVRMEKRHIVKTAKTKCTNLLKLAFLKITFLFALGDNIKKC